MIEEDPKYERTAQLNGYRPRSYGDIVAAAALISMLISCVAWGLKLEGELNEVRNEVVDLKAQVGNGILPRAEERIITLRRDLVYLAEEFKDHEENLHADDN